VDPAEFALAFVKYAQAAEVPLPDLVDFLIVVTTFADNDPEEEAYLKAIAPEVSADIGKIQKKLARIAIEDTVDM
jgi:hypothetical protein